VDSAGPHEAWWSTTRQLCWRDFDSFGHLTASAYPVVYGEAATDFVAAAWGTALPLFVVARLEVTYVHEVRPDTHPVRIHVHVARVGTASLRRRH
jgi:acyl-CoA thioesterase FadM